MLDVPMVCVRAVPAAARAEQLAAAEEARVAERIKDLGQEGLERLQVRTGAADRVVASCCLLWSCRCSL